MIIGLSLMALLAPAMAADVAATVRYDAISCRTVKNGPQGTCRVALVSRGDGKISAYVTSAEGRQRILYFRKGVPAFTDAGGQLRFERNRDTIIIRVGTAEIYEMPDRLVAGQ
jgi:hypothetical protein